MSEVYSPPRVVPFARASGLTGGWSLDISSEGPDGCAWDFDLDENRRKAEKLLDEPQPVLLIGSVMCTMFSVMKTLFRPQMGEEKFQKELKKARRHL